MGREKIEIGIAGEEQAAAFLRRNRYTIIATNVRTPFGEIDVIAKRRGVTVFVEVKARSSDSLGPPSLSVTPAKQHHLIKNVLWYLARKRAIDSPWRIDVISVMLGEGDCAASIELIENAVTVDGYDYRSRQ